MPRYFFDINDGNDIPDETGREIEGGEILRAEALHVVSGLLAAEAKDVKETTLVLSVRDESGAIPLTIRLVCQIDQT